MEAMDMPPFTMSPLVTMKSMLNQQITAAGGLNIPTTYIVGLTMLNLIGIMILIVIRIVFN